MKTPLAEDEIYLYIFLHFIKSHFTKNNSVRFSKFGEKIAVGEKWLHYFVYPVIEISNDDAGSEINLRIPHNKINYLNLIYA